MGDRRAAQFSRLVGAAVFGLAFALVSAAPSRAQLVDCPQIRGNASAFKVIVDEAVFARPGLDTDDELQRIRARLYFTVDNQLQELGLEMHSASAAMILAISCQGRHPRDVSDFDVQRSQDLTASKVVLEIWATLDASKQDGKVEDREARIGYALPPLRYYGPVTADLPGFYLQRYPRPGGGFSGILEGLPELSAYATLSLGLKAAKARDYDLAVPYLRKAEALLAAAPPPAPGPVATQHRVLLDYVKAKTCEAIRAALGDPDYQGGLRLAYARKKPCP